MSTKTKLYVKGLIDETDYELQYNFSNIKQTVCGEDFVVFLSMFGTIHTLGCGVSGQLGIGSNHAFEPPEQYLFFQSPKEEPGIQTVKINDLIESISCGISFVIVLSKTRIYVWAEIILVN